eukprot:5797994-Pyramimonas_sp.AAC.1
MSLADDNYDEDFLDDGFDETEEEDTGGLLSPSARDDTYDDDELLQVPDESDMDDELLVEFDLQELLDASGLEVKQILGNRGNVS